MNNTDDIESNIRYRRWSTKLVRLRLRTLISRRLSPSNKRLGLDWLWRMIHMGLGLQYDHYYSSCDTSNLQSDKGSYLLRLGLRLADLDYDWFYRSSSSFEIIKRFCERNFYGNITAASVGTQVNSPPMWELTWKPITSEEDKGIPCLYCDNVSPSRSALRMHVKKHNTNCKEIEFSHFLTKVSTLPTQQCKYWK